MTSYVQELRVLEDRYSVVMKAAPVQAGHMTIVEKLHRITELQLKTVDPSSEESS